MKTYIGVILLSVSIADCIAGVPKQPRNLVSLNSPKITETLTPGNGLNRGNWGPVDTCSANNFVSSFEFKFSPLGHVDDTAGNGIKLYCEDSQGEISYVTSSEATYGSWEGIRKCSGTNDLLNAVRLEVLQYQGTFGDDLGVTNIQFMCNSTGDILTGTTQIYKTLEEESDEDDDDVQELETEVQRDFIERNGVIYEKIQMRVHPVALDSDTPSYSGWEICSGSYTICGLQTRVEPDDPLNDDAGVTDAIFFCC